VHDIRIPTGCIFNEIADWDALMMYRGSVLICALLQRRLSALCSPLSPRALPIGAVWLSGAWQLPFGPATALDSCKGYDCNDDGVPGERVPPPVPRILAMSPTQPTTSLVADRTAL